LGLFQEADFDDDEDQEEGRETQISVTTSFLQEKEMACIALGDIFSYVGSPFLPYEKKLTTHPLLSS